MCGIFAYEGWREAEPVLLSGLRQLEYRGYDSAGLATFDGAELHLRRSAGRIDNLAGVLRHRPAPGCVGIGHTRWATHGPATETNAHPHLSADGQIAVVHNGVIENYALLRAQLEADGITFRSATDTEVIAQLIAQHYRGDLPAAVRAVLPLLQGTYGLVALARRQPGQLVAARLGSPLVLGIGAQENFLASDAAALAGLTDQVVYLQDHQTCILSGDRWLILDKQHEHIAAPVQKIEEQAAAAEKGDYPHYMLKEIYEQPEALANCMRGRLDADGATVHFERLVLDNPQLPEVNRLLLAACGTSYHAALVGEYLIEEFARLPVEVDYASEFRYRTLPIDRHTLVIAITQSGETADTLAALREAKRNGRPVMAVCNVVGSSIAREADAGIYLHAGREIGVASTKAFTCQVLVLAMLGLYLGRLRRLSRARGMQMIGQLRQVPRYVGDALACEGEVRRIAERFADAHNFLYLGRQYLFPVALEGALKLKEISYVHAEGYPAAEMKHGPIALVDEATPSVILALRGPVYDKVMSNLEEVKARGGPIIAIATEGDDAIARRADEVIYVPDVPLFLQPLVAAVPLQFLAYHSAVLRGCDVDRPRNLAKSVTVE